MSKFKVGDRVRVKQGAEGIGDEFWGKECTIVRDRSYGMYVCAVEEYLEEVE